MSDTDEDSSLAAQLGTERRIVEEVSSAWKQQEQIRRMEEKKEEIELIKQMKEDEEELDPPKREKGNSFGKLTSRILGVSRFVAIAKAKGLLVVLCVFGVLPFIFLIFILFSDCCDFCSL